MQQWIYADTNAIDSALSEAWQIMSLCLGMSYDDIGDELARWNETTELVRLCEGIKVYGH